MLAYKKPHRLRATVNETRLARYVHTPRKRIIYATRPPILIDALITRIQQGIKKLQEYSTALISTAVTGKIDVHDEHNE